MLPFKEMSMPPHEAPPPRNIAALDGLRGVAILLVLGVHLVGMDALPRQGLLGAIQAVFWTGWSGVDLFFALSGFLITGILLDTQRSSNYFSSFYGRRSLRIFPLYYAALLLAILLNLVVANTMRLQFPAYAALAHVDWLRWLAYFVYYQNWWFPPGNPSDLFVRHFWSLAVEEQFYLVWPLCILLLSRRSLMRLCLLLPIVQLAARIALVHRLGAHDGYLNANSFFRSDGLFLGALVATVVRDRSLLRRGRRAAPFLMAVSALGIAFIDLVQKEIWTRSTWTVTLGFSLYAIFYASLVFMVFIQNSSGKWLDRRLQAQWLRSFGKYSYGLYVIHMPVLLLVLPAARHLPGFGKNLAVALAVYSLVVGTSFGLAWVSYTYFESRFLRLKSRFQAR